MTDEKKKEKRIAMEEREERRKYPFEAIFTHKVLERGRHWITVELGNVSTEPLMDVIDIDFAESGTKRFASELYASEEGIYHLTARLFHEHKLISSKLATCYVTPLEE